MNQIKFEGVLVLYQHTLGQYGRGRVLVYAKDSYEADAKVKSWLESEYPAESIIRQCRRTFTDFEQANNNLGPGLSVMTMLTKADRDALLANIQKLMPHIPKPKGHRTSKAVAEIHGLLSFAR